MWIFTCSMIYYVVETLEDQRAARVQPGRMFHSWLEVKSKADISALTLSCDRSYLGTLRKSAADLKLYVL